MTSCNSYPESHPKNDSKAAEDLFGPAACMDYDRTYMGEAACTPIARSDIDYSEEELAKAVERLTQDTSPCTSPAYYRYGLIQPIDFISSQQLNFNEGCVVKYVTRARRKGNHLEDLMKAKAYIEHEIEQVRKNGE